MSIKGMSLKYANISVFLPVSKTYLYLVPDFLCDILKVGHGVLVPFGKRAVSGLVIDISDENSIETNDYKIKEIIDLLHLNPIIEENLIPFLKWVSDYYLHPIGEVIKTALPSGILTESKYFCFITEYGKARLEQKNLDPEFITILELFHANKKYQYNKLMDLCKKNGNSKHLIKLINLEMISVENKIEGPKVKPKYYTNYELHNYNFATTVTTAELKKNPKKSYILELLQEHSVLSYDEIKNLMSSNGLNINRLKKILEELEKETLIKSSICEYWEENISAFDLSDTNHSLTKEQSDALIPIYNAIESNLFKSILLFGVTGSGKTEIYLQAVEKTIQLGKQVLILVPEIALTPQLVGRFQARFKNKIQPNKNSIACMHSNLSQRERFDAWRRIQENNVSIVIGARSAIFAPLTNIGLIIVDEEHDQSFKQDSALRYNAKDLAVVRAKMLKSTVILGSATPSIESIRNAELNKYTLVRLNSRIENRPLPIIQILDMTLPECRPKSVEDILSPPMIFNLRETINKGQQAILLLNRRGFAPFILCPSCGASFLCSDCDISLTYHRKKNILLCHYCGIQKQFPKKCPSCESPHLGLLGHGTERLEDLLKKELPNVACSRLDKDTSSSKNAFLNILNSFRKEEFQILIGTQMVVKGHDFPNVTFVGVLQADYALNLPDFRAGEKTFQLLTQVAGRSGRGNIPGKVFIQTYTQHHPAIKYASKNDPDSFFNYELKQRKNYGYPPFFRIALIQISSKIDIHAKNTSESCMKILTTCIQKYKDGYPNKNSSNITIMGPSIAPLNRIQQWHRWQILIKSKEHKDLHYVLEEFLLNSKKIQSDSNVKLSIDIDPQNLL